MEDPNYDHENEQSLQVPPDTIDIISAEDLAETDHDIMLNFSL